MKNRYILFIIILVTQSFFGQINNDEIQLFDSYKNILKNINKVFLIDYVNKKDYFKKESIFIKESDIIDESFEKRNLALNSIKLISTNQDTIFYCNRGLNFNENQIVLFNIKNTINNTNFENTDNKKIELLENLVKQIEALSKLDETLEKLKNE